MLLQRVNFSSFLWLSSIPLCKCTTAVVSVGASSCFLMFFSAVFNISFTNPVNFSSQTLYFPFLEAVCECVHTGACMCVERCPVSF